MTVLVIMGASGCGKSTVADLLSTRLGWPFMEGDSLHPDTLLLVGRCREAGTPVTLHEVPGAVHVHPLTPTPEGRAGAREVVAALVGSR